LPLRPDVDISLRSTGLAGRGRYFDGNGSETIGEASLTELQIGKAVAYLSKNQWHARFYGRVSARRYDQDLKPHGDLSTDNSPFSILSYQLPSANTKVRDTLNFPLFA
jgi:hypothetical protein